MAASQRLALGMMAVAALGVAALVQAHRHPDQSIGGAGAGALALQLAAGLGACAAGLDLALRRSLLPSGALLAASGTAREFGDHASMPQWMWSQWSARANRRGSAAPSGPSKAGPARKPR